MNKRLLKEYIDRVGIVTLEELVERTGVANDLLCKPLAMLLPERSVFLCRLVQGRVTCLSPHLLFCLRTVWNEPDLTENAQDIYDWLSDNSGASTNELRKASELDGAAFQQAMHELQQNLCIAPLNIALSSSVTSLELLEADDGQSFMWVTDDDWQEGLYRATRYGDLGYCLSEMRRLMKKHFSTREINEIIYSV